MATVLDYYLSTRNAGGRSRGPKAVGIGLVLLALYGVYSVTVSPRLQPAGLNEPGRPVFDPGEFSTGGSIVARELADRWLASEPWAAQARYSLRSRDAVLYFNHWEPVDDNQAVRFRPFAMVWQNSEGDRTRPTVIISDSAWVRFEQKFDISGSNPGRIVGGALEGRVQVSGRNNLMVDGRNFVFSEEARRLWSDAAATFTWGGNRGEAHGVQLELTFASDVGATATGTGNETIAVTGLRRIRLRRDVVMDLVSSGDSVLPGSSADTAPPVHGPPADEQPDAADSTGTTSAENTSTADADDPADAGNLADTEEPTDGAGETDAGEQIAAAGEQPEDAEVEEPEKQPSTLKVRSTGPFEFDVETNLATFEDDVRVYRPTGENQYDSLHADLLTLQFEEAPETETPAAAPAATDSGFKGISSNLTFRRMRAEGRQVLLHSQGSGMRAFMKEFVYDAESRLAELVSPGGHVRVLQSDSELQCPRIQLGWDEQSEIHSMRCRGAGWLKYVEEDTGKLLLATEWKTELRRSPGENGRFDLIELVDDATVRQPEQQMGLAAQFIRLWVQRTTPQGEVAATGPAPLLPGGDPSPKPEKEKTSFRLNRMLALRDVAMVSPQMEAESGRLEVWFEDAGMAEGSPGNPHAKRETVRPASSTSAIPAEDPGTDGQPATDSNDGPFQVTADLIRVRVVRHQDSHAPAADDQEQLFRQVSETDAIGAGQQRHEVAEVWTSGNVAIRQPHEDGSEPLEVTGEELHLQNRGESGQLLTVLGQPAHLRDRSMHIEGRQVQLDRQANRATVHGGGLLQFPVSSSLDGKKLATPQMLDVWWRDEMTFDGRSAKFFGGVRTVMADSRMNCQDMEVHLSRRVSFTDAEPEDAARPEIATVICRHGVEFESHEYEGRKLVEIRRGHVAEFTVDQTTGDTKGVGPGWIALWRRGSTGRPGLGGAATARANSAARAKETGWDYTRIDFSHENIGNLGRRHATFDDRVEVIYGPVERPLEVFTVDELPEEAGWMQCGKLQVTQHAAEGKTPAHVELLGTGNSVLEGQGFHARADTISYDESKGLYMLRSLGSRKATIWRQKSAGEEFSRADAQRMEFIPARNQLKLDRTTGLNGLQ